jgi:hypothetical protein
MEKKIILKTAWVALLGSFFLASYTTATAGDQTIRDTFTRGPNKIIIERTYIGESLSTPKVKFEGTGKHGYTKDLKLKDGDLEQFISSGFPSNVIIKTEGSPGCTWYFYRGEWWRICY